METAEASKLIAREFLSGADKALVTTVFGRVPYRDLSIRNKRDYAERHGYDLLVYERGPDNSFNSKDMVLNKPVAIKDAFRTHNYTWVWWLDADCLIMNDDLKFTQLLPAMGERAGMVDLIVGGDANAVISPGSMLFRNAKWTTHLLDALFHRQSNKSVPGIRNWNEQGFLIHLYLTDYTVREHALVLPQRALNSFASNFVWGDFVIHFAGLGTEKNSLMQQFAQQKESRSLLEVLDR